MEPAPLESGLVAAADSVAGGAPDETLQTQLRAASHGDESAFAALYDRAAPRVFGLVQRILGDALQAEEVTQEVFLQVWETSNRFDPAHGSAESWIVSLAHRRAVDRIRSATSAHPTTETTWVSDGLDTLSTGQRQALELAYFGGQSHTEITRLLDLPSGTATMRIRDALIRLRDDAEPPSVS